MASIENKSRTQISVARRPELTKLFPHDKTKAAALYVAELRAAGHDPLASVLDESYLVRFKVKGKRKSRTAHSHADALAIKKEIEGQQHRGLFIDYTKAHQTKFHHLLERWVREEAPRLKGFLISAYKVNNWLADAGLPTLDIAAIHAAHPQPQDRELRIPAATGKRMSMPSEAAAFILKPFSDLEPDDFQDYVDERMEEVAAQTADRELDIVRRVCSLAIAKWRIHVHCDPFDGFERPDYFNERNRRLRPGEEQRLMAAAAEEDQRKAIERRTDELLAGTTAHTKYRRMSNLKDVRGDAEASCDLVPYMQAFIQFQLMAGPRKSETLKLKWSQIDFEAQTAFLPETKNGLPRTVPLRKDLLAWLRELPRDGEFVFPLSVPYLRKAWQRICKGAGIPTEGKAEERLRVHDLRHEAISRVAEAGSLLPGGITVVDLQAFSGHRDTRMLLRYLHLTPGGLAKRLDEAFKDQEQVQLHHGRRRLTKKAAVSMAEVARTPIVSPVATAASAKEASKVLSIGWSASQQLVSQTVSPFASWNL